MVFVLVFVFLAAFLLTLLFVPLARGWARRAGVVDVPGGRKGHDRPVPLGGGLAVAAATLVTLGGGATLIWAVHAGRADLPVLGETLYWLPMSEDVRVHLPGAVSQLPRLLLILAGGAVVAGLGFWDDLRDLSPAKKLLGQLAVGAALALGGDIRLSVFSEGAGAVGYAASLAATLVWFAAVVNAFNLLDHMDGICAGTAAVCGLAFAAVALQTGQHFIAALLLAGVGTAAGFLVFNFPPATVFLGDAGSQFLGYGLAVSTILFTFYEPPYPLFSYFVPGVVLAVPFYDVARVAGIRLAQRRSPFEADRNHLAHRLAALGLSPRQAALAVYALTGASGVAAALLYEATPAAGAAIFACVAAGLVLVGFLEAR